MAEVVAQCAARKVRTPTQYVGRWTEIAVVARERGHLADGQAELSFDAAADVDAARAALEEAVCGAIAAEEDCGPEPARERMRKLVEGLDRPRPRRGSGGKGKRREAAPARRLSEVRQGETIPHELRWNRCAELAASLELTTIEASLLSVVAMYAVTGSFVCWETRAGLMATARIKTNASFAAAVATLTRLGLLVPVDGSPRTAWHLGESFWGGLLAGEELETPVSKLVRGRRRAADRQAGPRRAGRRDSDSDRGREHGAGDSEVEDRPTSASGEEPSPDKSGSEEPESGSGGVENRTSDADGRNDAGDGKGRGGRKPGGKPGKGTGWERPMADGRKKVTVRRFVSEELADDPHREKIAQRLEEFFGRQGDRRVSRARQRGLAAVVRGDLMGVPPSSVEEAGRRRGGRMERIDPHRHNCRQCGRRFDQPGTGGDRGDGVCRACGLQPRPSGPVDVGALLDDLRKGLRSRGG